MLGGRDSAHQPPHSDASMLNFDSGRYGDFEVSKNNQFDQLKWTRAVYDVSLLSKLLILVFFLCELEMA